MCYLRRSELPWSKTGPIRTADLGASRKGDCGPLGFASWRPRTSGYREQGTADRGASLARAQLSPSENSETLQKEQNITGLVPWYHLIIANKTRPMENYSRLQSINVSYGLYDVIGRWFGWLLVTLLTPSKSFKSCSYNNSTHEFCRHN